MGERIKGIITNSKELSRWGHAKFVEKEARIEVDGQEKIIKRVSIEAPNGANVLPYFFIGNKCYIVLVAQFRTAVEAVTWEAPGGVVEDGEQYKIKSTLARELAEEAGIIIDANNIELVFKEFFIPSLTCGLGWGGLVQIKEKNLPLDRINGEPQEGEFTSLVVKSLDEIVDMRINQKVIFDLWTSRLIDEVSKRVRM